MEAKGVVVLDCSIAVVPHKIVKLISVFV